LLPPFVWIRSSASFLCVFFPFTLFFPTTRSPLFWPPPPKLSPPSTFPFFFFLLPHYSFRRWQWCPDSFFTWYLPRNTPTQCGRTCTENLPPRSSPIFGGKVVIPDPCFYPFPPPAPFFFSPTLRHGVVLNRAKPFFKSHPPPPKGAPRTPQTPMFSPPLYGPCSHETLEQLQVVPLGALFFNKVFQPPVGFPLFFFFFYHSPPPPPPPPPLFLPLFPKEVGFC